MQQWLMPAGVAMIRLVRAVECVRRGSRRLAWQSSWSGHQRLPLQCH